MSLTPVIREREPVAGSTGWAWPPNTHPVLRQVLSRRPIGSPAELKLELSQLRPVGQFDSLGAAVELLCRHRDDELVIVGDFDADGATSAALMTLCLRRLGFARVGFFIPDRFELGYGLTPGVVERLRNRPDVGPPALIITVDNGITSLDGVAEARASGIDVLITDHHLPAASLPEANAIVNPNAPGDAFSGKHLAGVGVAFYLLAALGRRLDAPRVAADDLDLVALGTVADLVPLDHSNRILIQQGLRRIRAGRCRPGLLALCRVAGIRPGDVTSNALGFKLAPRLNAAGRLDDMTVGVRCLVTEDEARALSLAQQLDSLNRERRSIEARMRAQAEALLDAEEMLQGDALPAVVCLFREDWHEGLVGLVASRMRERCHRPVIAFAPTESGALKGSGRSVPGFHLRDVLADVDRSHPGLMERFGGHAMAAGLTLRAGELAVFEDAVKREAEARMTAELLSGRIMTDGELRPQDFTLEVAAMLRDAGPWGQGFPEPSFEGHFEVVKQRVLRDAHLKMTLRPAGADTLLDSIAFNRLPGEWAIGEPIRIVYRLDVNDFHATPAVQLVVDHIEAAC